MGRRSTARWRLSRPGSFHVRYLLDRVSAHRRRGADRDRAEGAAGCSAHAWPMDRARSAAWPPTSRTSSRKRCAKPRWPTSRSRSTISRTTSSSFDPLKDVRDRRRSCRQGHPASLEQPALTDAATRCRPPALPERRTGRARICGGRRTAAEGLRRSRSQPPSSRVAADRAESAASSATPDDASAESQPERQGGGE